MRRILRYFLINLGGLWLTTQIVPGLTFSGGARSLIVAGLVFMLINIILVPLLKIMLLPLNLLTLGVFAWITNVLALYALTAVVPEFKLIPYTFEGLQAGIINLPPVELTTFLVAVAASFLIGVITHFLQWLSN